jgi:6-phosphogluconolactonase
VNLDLPRLPVFSRRTAIRSMAAAACLYAFGARAEAPDSARFAYIGTYTGAAGNGQGIYRFRMNQATGELTQKTLVAPSDSPSWLVVHPSGKTLYAGNEISTFHGNSGSVSAFAIDPATGALRALNIVSSQGAGPAYITLDRSGRHMLVANYIAGTIAVLPVLPDGSLGDATDVHHDTGSIGSTTPTDAPPDSFAISGHDAPHAHMILPDPSNRFVLSTDLGQDRIYSWRFDAEAGKLTPNSDQPYVSLPTGDGPRHLAFHPSGRFLYSIQEEASTLVCFDYDAATGRLSKRGDFVSTLPEGFIGTSFASEVLVSRDGRFLYAGNRLHDSIGVFAIDHDGGLRHIADCSTHGDYPAQFQFDPSGRFLYACNHRSDCVTVFRVDSGLGTLTFTGQYIPAGSPGCIQFLS